MKCCAPAFQHTPSSIAASFSWAIDYRTPAVNPCDQRPWRVRDAAPAVEGSFPALACYSCAPRTGIVTRSPHLVAQHAWGVLPMRGAAGCQAKRRLLRRPPFTCLPLWRGDTGRIPHLCPLARGNSCSRLRLKRGQHNVR